MTKKVAQFFRGRLFGTGMVLLLVGFGIGSTGQCLIAFLSLVCLGVVLGVVGLLMEWK